MTKQRIAYIDQIKVWLTCLVVAHHAGQAYGPTGGVWVVNDDQKTAWMGQFFFVNASYMMGLYFFISGYFMVFSMQRKTNLQFLSDRMKRLGIPLLFFTLLVFLPFNYLASDRSLSIAAFFVDTYFKKPPIATGHLWFVASLLLYSFLYILIVRVPAANQGNTKPFRFWYVWVYIIALSIVTGFIRMYYPVDTWRTWLIPIEVAHLPQYLSLFFIGTIFNKYGWLNAFRRLHGLLLLCVAIAAYLIAAFIPSTVRDYWITEALLESLLCVGISVFLLVFFKYYLNKTIRLTTLLSENAYGIYLFHLLIVIAIQQLFAAVPVSANLKFLLVTLLSIALSLLVSFLLRKIGWIRRIM